MSPNEFHRAVARATGESVRMIKRLGFSPLEPSAAVREAEIPETGPQVVDWDQLETERISLAIQA